MLEKVRKVGLYYFIGKKSSESWTLSSVSEYFRIIHSEFRTLFGISCYGDYSWLSNLSTLSVPNDDYSWLSNLLTLSVPDDYSCLHVHSKSKDWKVRNSHHQVHSKSKDWKVRNSHHHVHSKSIPDFPIFRLWVYMMMTIPDFPNF
jgi:hypothetical protein